MAMDLPSFNSLLSTIHKVTVAEASRDAWTSLIAAAVDQKAMKSHIKQIVGPEQVADGAEVAAKLNEMGK